MNPIFSIITACHNNAPFLPDYFNSVLKQGNDVEVIFVDDCSTDGSYEYASSIANKNNMVHVIKSDNRVYCSSAYRIALSIARAPVVGVVDADDALLSGAVTRILKTYDAHKLDFIYTQHWWCDKKLKPQKLGLSSAPKKGKSMAQMAAMKRHCFSHWRTFRRECDVPSKLFPDGLRYAVDKNLGFVLETVGRGGFLDVPLYFYRYYKENMSCIYPSEQKKLWISLASKYADKRSYPIVKLSEAVHA